MVVRRNIPVSKHRINHSKLKSLSPKEWNGKMERIPCFLLGNGPSINDVDLSLLDNYFTIGINRIFYIYDPTILIWQDLALWIQEKKKVLQTKAIKYCREGAETRGGFYTFKLQGREPRRTLDCCNLYGRGSSGTITFQFADALGCDPIILLGMDCCYGKNKQTDFYGNNSMHKSHTLPNCIKGLQFIRDIGKNIHKIINCSHNSVFKEKYTLEEAVSMLPEKKYTREELENILLGK